jgi:hypothetical protein
MDQDRLVPSCGPVFLYGEGCHPAAKVPLIPRRIDNHTWAGPLNKTADDRRLPFFLKLDGTSWGASDERCSRVHLAFKPHTESYSGINICRVGWHQRAVNRRPESSWGALQLTANDELSISDVSLTDTPYDFRWYLRRVFLPARA